MRFLVMILRVFSYGYHTLLGLFLVGIGLVGKLSASHTSFSTLALPGEGASQVTYALGLGLAALVTVALALFKNCRPPFVVWTMIAAILIFRGFFWSSYSFEGGEDFESALCLFGGSILAFLGAALSTKARA
ncbi:MAG: hypothetical protein IT164_06275 [Bryobacterales bacterium]|nr:hypothetical protein [Bryobacterales bacterium]